MSKNAHTRPAVQRPHGPPDVLVTRSNPHCRNLLLLVTVALYTDSAIADTTMFSSVLLTTTDGGAWFVPTNILLGTGE